MNPKLILPSTLAGTQLAPFSCRALSTLCPCAADRHPPGTARGRAARSREEAGTAEGRAQERVEEHEREVPGRGERVAPLACKKLSHLSFGAVVSDKKLRLEPRENPRFVCSWRFHAKDTARVLRVSGNGAEGPLVVRRAGGQGASSGLARRPAGEAPLAARHRIPEAPAGALA